MVGVIAEPETAGADGVAVQGNLRCGLEAQVESRDCYGHRVVESTGGVGQVEVGDRVFDFFFFFFFFCIIRKMPVDCL